MKNTIKILTEAQKLIGLRFPGDGFKNIKGGPLTGVHIQKGLEEIKKYFNKTD